MCTLYNFGVCLFVCFLFLHRLVWNLLYTWGQPWIPDTPGFTFWVLTCTTTFSMDVYFLKFIFIIFSYVYRSVWGNVHMIAGALRGQRPGIPQELELKTVLSTRARPNMLWTAALSPHHLDTHLKNLLNVKLFKIGAGKALSCYSAEDTGLFPAPHSGAHNPL